MSKPDKIVLVVSENRQPFALAACLLKAEGYSVRFAGDGRESFQIAEAEPPAMIISELAMPDIDGLKICRQFRSDHRLRGTPILLVGDLSGDSSIVEDGRRCGADDYVQRPFSFNALADKVIGMLDTRLSVFQA